MNYPKYCDIDNFDKYDNKYAILLKNKILIKKMDFIDKKTIQKILSYPEYHIYKNIIDDYYIVICMNKMLIPIYGHFYNNKDVMLCKKVSKKFDDSKYILVKRSQIYCNSYKHPIFFNTLNICNKNIDILHNDINVIKYDGPDIISKYENSNKYEKINPEEFE